MPRLDFAALETPSPTNGLGAKGVGEAGTIGAPAAILNAVADALAHFEPQDLALPLTSEALWRTINGLPPSGTSR
jgi:carbon-monoxide dehydrogenase large subunit